ncbi:cytidine deaminase [Halobacillus litoralis]|uniref:cytidine deaminase n=1 Tax=Halobacillus litoralis TaxID=45668 RepID=UPI001CFD47E8|nr:cytidine deaminase [Halobacillus litoralis]
MNQNELINHAKEIRTKAYTPYSKFQVGAALLTEDGTLYTGCNIENAAYPVTCCAERVAIFKAISEGHQKFKELAVVADTKRPVPPCGSCRQVMSEFFDSNVTIYTTNLDGETKTFSMDEILPFSFASSDLPEEQK